MWRAHTSVEPTGAIWLALDLEPQPADGKCRAWAAAIASSSFLCSVRGLRSACQGERARKIDSQKHAPWPRGTLPVNTTRGGDDGEKARARVPSGAHPQLTPRAAHTRSLAQSDCATRAQQQAGCAHSQCTLTCAHSGGHCHRSRRGCGRWSRQAHARCASSRARRPSPHTAHGLVRMSGASQRARAPTALAAAERRARAAARGGARRARRVARADGERAALLARPGRRGRRGGRVRRR